MHVRLALFLAWRSMRRHGTVSWATALGVAIAMTVVGAILIVDANSVETRIHGQVMTGALELSSARDANGAPKSRRAGTPRQVLRVTFERGGEASAAGAPPPLLPTQEGQAGAGLQADAPPVRRGEEDYQVMRLAVRVASLLAFSVGAVIVFYTMRFSVASRGRELSLLRCLGEARGNLVLALLLEALLLGFAGTLIGLTLAFPVATSLIDAGISTTGRMPSHELILPWWELGVMGLLSLSLGVLGVAGPARGLYRVAIAEVLQPRFAAPGIDERNLEARGFGWLIPPLMAAGWLALRPFLQSWLSVVELFLLESLFAAVLASAVLWWMKPVLKAAIRLAELLLRPLMPLESLLVGRRLRLTSQKLVFTLAGVTLVFSLLIALHDVTRALKMEIANWAREAVDPYVFLMRRHRVAPDPERLDLLLKAQGLYLFRMSGKVPGELPLRLVRADDVNPFLRAQGRPELGPGLVLVSHTLAARFSLTAGDRVLIHTDDQIHRFTITEVSDDPGYFADDGQYVDLKSYFLFSDGSPLFSGPVSVSLGKYAAARRIDGGPLFAGDLDALGPYYYPLREGRSESGSQLAEIDRDFLIFDFILAMTLVLAAVGVANSILIQVHARERELSVLRTVGVSRGQTARLLLAEGAVIGLVSGVLSLFLGHAFGALSIAFLDRFTLFDYSLALSLESGVWTLLMAVAVCSLAAVYPAMVAGRVSSAESLHYE